MAHNNRTLYLPQAHSNCDVLQNTNSQTDFFYYACYLQENLQSFKYAIQPFKIQHKF